MFGKDAEVVLIEKRQSQVEVEKDNHGMTGSKSMSIWKGQEAEGVLGVGGSAKTCWTRRR
jgi:hypothetical protein